MQHLLLSRRLSAGCSAALLPDVVAFDSAGLKKINISAGFQCDVFRSHELNADAPPTQTPHAFLI